MQWRAYIYDISGTFVAEIPIESLDISKKLNLGATASMTAGYRLFLNSLTGQGVTVQNTLTAGLRTVKIYLDSTLMFSGFLDVATIQKFDLDINVNLAFKSWIYYFTKRFITKTYSAQGDGDIAWDLIDTAQADTYGDIGITQGTITNVTDPRDRTYNRDEVMKSIYNLSNSNIDGGFEYEITNAKVFTTATRLGSDRPEIVFDKSNIDTFLISNNIGLSIATQVNALGGGVADSQIIKTQTASTALRTKWYLQEKDISFIDVEDPDVLDDHATEALADAQDSSLDLELVVRTNNVAITEYDVGDSVTVNIEDAIDDELMRIITRQIQVRQGVTKARLEFDRLTV